MAGEKLVRHGQAGLETSLSAAAARWSASTPNSCASAPTSLALPVQVANGDVAPSSIRWPWTTCRSVRSAVRAARLEDPARRQPRPRDLLPGVRCAAAPVFDTQIAATLAGSRSRSLWRTRHEVLGERLDKATPTRTGAATLSETQVAMP